MCRPALMGMLLAALCVGATAADEKDKPSAAGGPSRALFEPAKIWNVQITVDAKEYQAMQPRGGGGFPGFGGPPRPKPVDGPKRPAREVHRNKFGVDLPWATGTFTIGDQTFKDVGMRYLGNGTIGDASGTIKKSFKIDLDHFGEEARFLGVKKINLHCGVADPSKCRETLGYAAYRAAGVPAPRTSLAEVRLTVPGKYDRELLGVYTIVEHVDKPFLRAFFGTDKGLLMKPEGLRDLEYRGEEWDRYKKNFVPKRDATPGEAKRIVAFVRLIHKADDDEFRKEIGSYLDVDAYLRFLAATAYVANTDSFFVLGHNFYIYLDPTGKFHFIPWDLDRSFANFPILGSNDQQMNMSFTHPYAGSHRLTERLLATPGVTERYQKLLKELADTPFEKERMLKEVTAIESRVKELVDRGTKAAEARKERAGPGMFGKPPILTTFVEKRTASLATQIAGTSKGYVPTGGFGPRPFKAGEMMAGPFLAAFDTDKDGKLSKNEWL
ncbi:MAG TPA: CotH kinase family protein, partial [Gemmataceae bacterium]|nr:CotH kinase family protein [Gemmataceae bacterium]